MPKIFNDTTIVAGAESAKALGVFLEEIPQKYSKAFMLVDSNTCKHCLPLLDSRFELPGNLVVLETEPGEESKNPEICTRLWNDLAKFGADRHALLICLGGGVISDLGGFVASTYQRGIDFLYLPTTLLAQVDAAIGGKTGVNLNKLKNYIGVFSQPVAVFILTDFLQTLPFGELLSGYAEVVKHALLTDEKAFRQLVRHFPTPKVLRTHSNWGQIVEHSVKVKQNIVKADPLESGLRKILNLGHSVGHAFESYALKKEGKNLMHGYAVAMGLIVEIKLSVLKCGFPENLANEIIDYLLTMFPFYFFDPVEIPALIDLMKFDKKNRDGLIRMSLMNKPGDVLTDVVCSSGEIENCLREYLKLSRHLRADHY